MSDINIFQAIVLGFTYLVILSALAFIIYKKKTKSV